MKIFNRISNFIKSIKKPALVSAVCLVALSGLVVSRADNDGDPVDDHSDLDIPGLYIPLPEETISDEEFRLRTSSETGMALPDDESSDGRSFINDFESSVMNVIGGKKKHSRWIDSFKYTEAGGLQPANSTCKLFMNEKGEYGSYGRIVTNYIDDEMKSSGRSVFLSNSILGMTGAPKICPNWSKLNDATKKKFWVWVFAAVASTESSCNAGVKEIKGPNDRCSGLLQLEKGYALRAHRGPSCAGVSPADIRKPYANLRCGMDIMRGQLISRGPNEEIEFDGRIYPGPGMKATSYWLKLRKVNGAVIGKLIRSFAPCGA